MEEKLCVNPDETLNCLTPVDYTPEQVKQKLLQEHTVYINWLSIGCVVTIGCKKIPFASSSDALAAIAEYVKDPSQSIREWLKKLS